MGTLVRLIAVGVVTASTLAVTPAAAQNKEKRSTQEVIIRKKGPSSEKMTIIIDGDSITVNGKPLRDHDNENVVILRKSHSDIPDFPEIMAEKFRYLDVPGIAYGGNQAILGVVTEDKSGGAHVVSVTPGSGAEKAGIKEGDVIVGVDSKKIERRDDLLKAIGELKPDTTITVQLVRNGKKETVKATVSARRNTGLRFFNEAPGGIAIDGYARGFGLGKAVDIPLELRLRSLVAQQNQPFRLGASVQDAEDGKGVKVLDVEKNSAAEKAGLKEDDLILSFDGKEVNDAVVLAGLVRSAAQKKSVTMKISRKGKNMDIQVEIPRKLKTAHL